MKNMAVVAIVGMISVSAFGVSEAAARAYAPTGRQPLAQALTKIHQRLRQVLPGASAERLKSLLAQVRKLVERSRAMLQGATNGTIGPQAGDAAVRVNNLANLEAALNIITDGWQLLGIAWGGPTMIMGFLKKPAPSQDAMRKVLFGAAGVTGGLATPGVINWLVASARDANLFSRSQQLLQQWASALKQANAASLLSQIMQRMATMSIPRVGWEVLVH
jgi:hypothetical protein